MAGLSQEEKNLFISAQPFLVGCAYVGPLLQDPHILLDLQHNMHLALSKDLPNPGAFLQSSNFSVGFKGQLTK